MFLGGWVGEWVGGWVGGKVDGSKSGFKDCLQQSKIGITNEYFFEPIGILFA
jgi:hypothetical protein